MTFKLISSRSMPIQGNYKGLTVVELQVLYKIILAIPKKGQFENKHSFIHSTLFHIHVLSPNRREHIKHHLQTSVN